MRSLLLSAIGLALTALAICSIPPSAVSAVGTPTENYTIPDLPTSDPMHDEIKPQVNYFLQGPSLQVKTSPPAFQTSFTGPLELSRYIVVGDGQWYLDVDINIPGWLYIYEYYPPNNNPSGRWLAYKWQLKQSGAWYIGPFNARPDEPEGQHVYRLWFYGNGQWAVTNPSIAQNSLIYWTYLKNSPELKILSFDVSPRDVRPGGSVTLSWNVQGAKSIEITMVGPVTGASGTQAVTMDRTTDFNLTATGLDGRQAQSGTVTVNVSAASPLSPSPSSPVAPAPPAKTASFLDELLNPITLISIISVVVIVVLGLLLRSVYLKRWAGPSEESAPVEVKKEEKEEALQEMPPPAPEPPQPIRAKLVLPDGLEIPLTDNQVVGRAHMARALGLDELCLISRKQFQVTCSDGQYFIEDTGSDNGTKLNGEDIKDKGTLPLKDGDTIDAAGAIKLTFSVLDD